MPAAAGRVRRVRRESASKGRGAFGDAAEHGHATGDVLDDREKKIIFQRFGLHGGKPKTLEEVGKKFGVTRERIRQLQNIALSKLRRALSKKERPVEVELPVEA